MRVSEYFPHEFANAVLIYLFILNTVVLFIIIREKKCGELTLRLVGGKKKVVLKVLSSEEGVEGRQPQ